MSIAVVVADACGNFSGSDTSVPDGGDSVDAGNASIDGSADAGNASIDGSADAGLKDATDSSPAALPPTACDLDAAGALFCDSFELPAVACGANWLGTNGTGTIMEGGAHGGGHYCHFCATMTNAELDHHFAYASYGTYQLSAFVRSPTGADSGTNQLFAYPPDAASFIGRKDSTVPLKKVAWTPVQGSVINVGTSTTQVIDFYIEPYATNNGECIDVDDVVLVGTP